MDLNLQIPILYLINSSKTLEEEVVIWMMTLFSPDLEVQDPGVKEGQKTITPYHYIHCQNTKIGKDKTATEKVG